MKKTTLSLSILIILPFMQVYADEYIKNNGTLTLSPENSMAAFNINSSHDNSSGVCNIDGVAESVDAGAEHRNRWVYNDSASKCVAVISELKDGSVKVLTRSCGSYCGVSAAGSMDGKYKHR